MCDHNGQCSCNDHVTGLKCSECSVGYDAFPACDKCAAEYYGYPNCIGNNNSGIIWSTDSNRVCFEKSLYNV